MPKFCKSLFKIIPHIAFDLFFFGRSGSGGSGSGRAAWLVRSPPQRDGIVLEGRDMTPKPLYGWPATGVGPPRALARIGVRPDPPARGVGGGHRPPLPELPPAQHRPPPPPRRDDATPPGGLEVPRDLLCAHACAFAPPPPRTCARVCCVRGEWPCARYMTYVRVDFCLPPPRTCAHTQVSVCVLCSW